jgi:hypothetical protein
LPVARGRVVPLRTSYGRFRSIPRVFPLQAFRFYSHL